MTFTLQASKRDETGKAVRQLREGGSMPAVVYGPKHKAESITLSLPEFTKVLRDAGESSMIELKGLDVPLQVLIHEVDRDPVTTVPRHADFYAVEKGAKVQVNVPLEFVGEAPAVKKDAAVVKVMHELPVEAEPVNLPHEIEVDISVLAEVGDQVLVKDLKLPAGVVATVEGEDVVALTQALEEEPEEEVVEPDMDAIEAEQKGKEEGEAEGETSDES